MGQEPPLEYRPNACPSMASTVVLPRAQLRLPPPLLAVALAVVAVAAETTHLQPR